MAGELNDVAGVEIVHAATSPFGIWVLPRDSIACFGAHPPPDRSAEY
jgi:hypothetical protein